MASAGVSEAVVVVGYRAGQLMAHVDAVAPVPVRYVHQEELRGSGHALGLCRKATRGEPFLLTWADIVTEPGDYPRVAAAWGEDLDAVVGVVELEDVSEGAAVVIAESGTVTEIVEKPVGEPPSRWNSAGVLAVGPAIWEHIAALEPSARGELEFTDALAALIAAGGRVEAVELRGPWFDIGTEERLAAAHQAWA